MKIGKKIIDGFEDYVFQETLLEGYEDITSVQNFVKIGDYLFKDYKWIRKRLQEQNWNTLSPSDKIVVSQYRASTEENCKVTLGENYQYWASEFGLKSKLCREVRFENAKTILFRNVSLLDRYNILGFLNTTLLVDNYIKHGIEGTAEGDPISGLFNYIEATGDYVSNGLTVMTLTMIGDKSKEEMIIEIMDCLRKGEY